MPVLWRVNCGQTTSVLCDQITRAVKDKFLKVGNPVVFEHSRQKGFMVYTGPQELKALQKYVIAAVKAVTAQDAPAKAILSAKQMGQCLQRAFSSAARRTKERQAHATVAASGEVTEPSEPSRPLRPADIPRMDIFSDFENATVRLPSDVEHPVLHGSMTWPQVRR